MARCSEDAATARTPLSSAPASSPHQGEKRSSRGSSGGKSVQNHTATPVPIPPIMSNHAPATPPLAAPSSATPIRPKPSASTRGVDDPERLPHYPYRDDGLLVWEALRQLVGEVVHLFYTDDAAVSADVELRMFLREVVEEGLPGCDLPVALAQRDALIDLVTGIIFASPAGHAAINSQMFKQHAFLPNAPWRLDGAIPTGRGVLNASDLVSWLPDRLTAERTMDMMAVLGLREVPGFFKTDEPNLGDDPIHSGHPGVHEAYARFRDALDAVDATIQERNRARRMPYDAFLREHITASASW